MRSRPDTLTRHERAANLARAARTMTLACGYVLVGGCVVAVRAVLTSGGALVLAGALALGVLALVYTRAFVRGSLAASPSFEALDELARASYFFASAGYALYVLAADELLGRSDASSYSVVVDVLVSASGIVLAFAAAHGVTYTPAAGAALAYGLVYVAPYANGITRSHSFVLALARVLVWAATLLIVAARHDGREPLVYWHTRPVLAPDTHLTRVVRSLVATFELTTRALALSAWALYGSPLLLPLVVPVLLVFERAATLELRVSPLESRSTGDAYLSRTIEAHGNVL